MFSKIAIATLAGAAHAVSVDDSTGIFKNFDFSGMQMLETLINDSVTFNNILDHGCWCAKLDPLSESSMLGGATPVDELDDICRRWAVARHCNDDNEGGTCCNYSNGRCRRDQSAQRYYVDHQRYLNAGQTGTHRAICPTTLTSSSGEVRPTLCARESCYIDFIFADEIVDWINNPENSGWAPSRVQDFDTCLLPEMMDMLKRCDTTRLYWDGVITLINTNDYKTHSGYGVRDTNYYAGYPGDNQVVNADALPLDHQARGEGQDPN